MKKLMMILAAIVSLQGASMNGAWAGVKAFGQGLNAMISSPAAISTGLFSTGLGLMVNGHVQSSTNGKLDMIFASPVAQKFLGLDKPTTWYGKAWKFMGSVDETVGSIARWCGYAVALTQMVHAMSATQPDQMPESYRQAQPVDPQVSTSGNAQNGVIRRARA